MNRIDGPQAAKLRMECLKVAQGPNERLQGEAVSRQIVERAGVYADFVLGTETRADRIEAEAAKPDGSLLEAMTGRERTLQMAGTIQIVTVLDLQPGDLVRQVGVFNDASGNRPYARVERPRS